MMRTIACLRHVTLIATALLSAWLGTACAQSKPTQTPPTGTGSSKPAPAEAAPPVALTLKLDQKTYKPNEPVKMTLTVKNPGKNAITLNFASGQRYDFELRRGKDKKGDLVWKWSRGRMFTMALSSLSLAPGKTLTYTETAAKDEEKDTLLALPAGTYTAIATLTIRGTTSQPSTSTTFTVQSK